MYIVHSPKAKDNGNNILDRP